jgi:hypothetical protein
MLHGRVALLLLPLAFLLLPSRADACSCVGGLPICQTFWEADAVFAGEVLSIDPVPDGADPAFSRKRVRFQVQETWRGGVEGVVEIRTGAGGGDCGYRFERGETYLVYAHGHEGTLSTSICTRTKKLAAATEDLQYIRTALQAEATGHIYGTVRRQQSRTTGEPDRVAAGYKVTLSNDKRTWTSETNAEGRFEFTGIPAGTYAITLGTSSTERAYGPREVTLADSRACMVADFSVAPDGRVAASGLRR